MTQTNAAPATAAYTSHAPAPAATCRNCGAALGGRHCADCGQRHVDDLEPTLRELADDATSELLSFDGRIFETLRLLVTRPGELTAEHLRGRRARYVAPLKLYLTVSVAYFVLLAATQSPEPRAASGPEVQAATARPAAADPADSVARRRAQDMVELERLGERKRGPLRVLLLGSARLSTDTAGTKAAINAVLPKLMFAMMPVFAFVLYRRYRGNGRRYVTHLYFALHFFAFWMVLSIPAHVLALPSVGVASSAIMWVSLAILLGYLVAALQRVHGGSLARTCVRATVAAAQFAVAFFVMVSLTCIVLMGLR